MDRDEFIRIAALIYTEPKEFDGIMRSMLKEENWEYNLEKCLWLEEQELARKEKRLH